MQLRIETAFVLLIAICAIHPAAAVGQVQFPIKAGKPFRGELALDYTYLRSNVPPGGSGCLSQNGASGTFAWQLNAAPFALVIDVAVTHAGAIAASVDSLTQSTFMGGERHPPRLGKMFRWHQPIVLDGRPATSGDDLTQSTFTAGGRYVHRLGNSALRTYGQALVGLAHASGPLVQRQNPGAVNAGTAFASNFGGGVDFRASQRFSLRLIEADYLLTTLDNGANNRQNNMRIGLGLVITFAKSR
jgi:hypothetical protein